MSVLTVAGLSKTYASGFHALKNVDLEIRRGEIFALLGPNGAGKTTLINIVCGIVTASTGSVTADGHDIVRDFRAARAKIGLVPQELTTDMFETVWNTLTFSRGLFGKPRNPEGRGPHIDAAAVAPEIERHADDVNGTGHQSLGYRPEADLTTALRP